ncbi:ribonuclease E/G [Sphingomonas piscis]|uniref:Ribonuclease E n=1 Tax=Sphingomonas piscis TaxID=2714943 RepID=A0A6G7YRI4_9SPHN|nr:ribonuclease E/G [Sphingomonas piscis]QIK79344.1 ribonuclease E/G [Sphingomonas piscis]
MNMRMLIDARHPEETRVAVVKGNRVEEFDFESAEHKQLKGNIYLAKVTRVEPSLQAAFVDYGGNRHGFLAFSEIHPDYYQIPKADREALLREEAEHAAEEERLRNAHDDDHDHDHSEDGRDDDGHADEHDDHEDENGEPREGSEEASAGAPRSAVDESAADELRRKRMNLRRRYKIQDVIQRRQVLLVQVVKEERGNKGAALTTYLSLAGRYCVLMPNTSHGGGISRKISNGADRKRLKTIMADLNLPSTMGLIVRTAGLSRTKVEIKRDFDYLARLWDEIREKTLGSSAPALIYRDSDLIKRAIRDLYHRDIDEVLVEGDEGFKAARGFMKLLMPSHVRRVKLHSDSTPMFQRFGVEDQLGAMYQPVVQLKSGGYLVINPTEALVSIDINSGRSTREHNIEQTAYNTNLEAAAEIARQLRLRDMAGLVVIDFIDMEQNSHVRKVEKAMKEALKNDRARIQVGRISSFGLMEMSRQRLRTGVLEASTKACPHCEGTGLMRTAASAGLSALRMIEDEATRGRGEKICLRAGREAAIYLLNKKRAELGEIEKRYGVQVEVIIDESLEGARMTVESSGPRPVAQPRPQIAAPVEEEDASLDLALEEDEEEEEEEAEDEERSERGEGRRDERHGDEDRNGRRRRRRRRGGRGRSRREGGEEASEQSDEGAEQPETVADAPERSEAPTEDSGERPRRRRRRGGRGGGEDAPAADAQPDVQPDASPMIETPVAEEAPVAETAPAEEAKPRTRRRPRARAAEAAAAEPTAEAAPEIAAEAPAAPEAAEAAPEAPAKKPRARRTKKSEAPVEAAAEAPAETPEAASDAAPVPAADNDSAAEQTGEPRRGWWQRTFG